MPRIAVDSGLVIVVGGHTPFIPTIPIPLIPTPKGKKFVRLDPIQIAGLIELNTCDEVICRTFNEICTECNLVFGDAGVLKSTYENDFNSFFLDYSIFQSNPLTATIVFKLQKFLNGVWVDSITLNDNTNGIFHAINTIKDHPTYAGYEINWGQVIVNKGVGFYRFRAESTFGAKLGCLVSPPFRVVAWDCIQARGTVKFETKLTGIISDKRQDFVLYDLCGFNLLDSVRLPGWFGYYKVPEYKEVLLEFGKPEHGRIQRVRDEAIQSFEYLSKYLQFYLHHRFSVYGMMADELKVSDYNTNNSDFDIKQMLIVKNGAYELEYIDNKGRRRSKVKVIFNRGVQGVIKSLCCDPVEGS